MSQTSFGILVDSFERILQITPRRWVGYPHIIQLCYRAAFYLHFNMSPYCSGYIIPFGLRALASDYTFVTEVAVTPSLSLTISGYIQGLARDCLRESFPEFTQFATRARLGSERDQLIRSIRRNVAFLHSVNNRLDMTGTKRYVVCRASGSVCVKVDCCSACARRGLSPQCSILELQIGLNVEIFPGVVFSYLFTPVLLIRCCFL